MKLLSVLTVLLVASFAHASYSTYETRSISCVSLDTPAFDIFPRMPVLNYMSRVVHESPNNALAASHEHLTATLYKSWGAVEHTLDADALPATAKADFSILNGDQIGTVPLSIAVTTTDIDLSLEAQPKDFKRVDLQQGIATGLLVTYNFVGHLVSKTQEPNVSSYDGRVSCVLQYTRNGIMGDLSPFWPH